MPLDDDSKYITDLPATPRQRVPPRDLSDPLDAIAHYESNDRNVPNYRYDSGHTAQGHYQITNTNWRNYGPKAGVDTSQFPSAMKAPKDIQRNVANTMFQEHGFGDWAPYNPALRAGLQRGEGQGGSKTQPSDDDAKYITDAPDDDSKYISQTPAAPVQPRQPPAQRKITSLAEAKQADEAHIQATDKLSRDIAWHFGDSVLNRFNELPDEQQIKIAQLATKYAAADEVKKRKGQPIVESYDWKRRNQEQVGVKGDSITDRGEMMIRQQGLTPEQLAQRRDDVTAESNPLLKSTGVMRWLKETGARGTAGLLHAAAGVGQIAARGGSPGAQAGVDTLRQKAHQLQGVAAQAEERAPMGWAAEKASGLGAGLIEFAPLLAMGHPEGVLPGIAAGAGSFGGYSGLQAYGETGSAKEALKAGVKAAPFGALMGVPGSVFGNAVDSGLRNAFTSGVVKGAGYYGIGRAEGMTPEEAGENAAVLSAFAGPELAGEALNAMLGKAVRRPGVTPLNTGGPMEPAVKSAIESAFEVAKVSPEIAEKALKTPVIEPPRPVEPIDQVLRPAAPVAQRDDTPEHPLNPPLGTAPTGERRSHPRADLAEVFDPEQRAQIQQQILNAHPDDLDNMKRIMAGAMERIGGEPAAPSQAEAAKPTAVSLDGSRYVRSPDGSWLYNGDASQKVTSPETIAKLDAKLESQRGSFSNKPKDKMKLAPPGIKTGAVEERPIELDLDEASADQLKAEIKRTNRGVDWRRNMEARRALESRVQEDKDTARAAKLEAVAIPDNVMKQARTDVKARQNYGRRNITPEKKSWRLSWSNAGRDWYVHYDPVPRGRTVNLDSNEILVASPTKMVAEAVAHRLTKGEPIPLAVLSTESIKKAKGSQSNALNFIDRIRGEDVLDESAQNLGNIDTHKPDLEGKMDMKWARIREALGGEPDIDAEVDAMSAEARRRTDITNPASAVLANAPKEIGVPLEQRSAEGLQKYREWLTQQKGDNTKELDRVDELLRAKSEQDMLDVYGDADKPIANVTDLGDIDTQAQLPQSAHDQADITDQARRFAKGRMQDFEEGGQADRGHANRQEREAAGYKVFQGAASGKFYVETPEGRHPAVFDDIVKAHEAARQLYEANKVQDLGDVDARVTDLGDLDSPRIKIRLNDGTVVEHTPPPHPIGEKLSAITTTAKIAAAQLKHEMKRDGYTLNDEKYTPALEKKLLDEDGPWGILVSTKGEYGDAGTKARMLDTEPMSSLLAERLAEHLAKRYPTLNFEADGVPEKTKLGLTDKYKKQRGALGEPPEKPKPAPPGVKTGAVEDRAKEAEPIIGIVASDGTVRGRPDPGRNLNHGRLFPETWSTADHWHYEPSTETVYWTGGDSHVSTEAKHAAENFLDRKGLDVKRHSDYITYLKDTKKIDEAGQRPAGKLNFTEDELAYFKELDDEYAAEHAHQRGEPKDAEENLSDDELTARIFEMEKTGGHWEGQRGNPPGETLESVLDKEPPSATQPRTPETGRFSHSDDYGAISAELYNAGKRMQDDYARIASHPARRDLSTASDMSVRNYFRQLYNFVNTHEPEKLPLVRQAENAQYAGDHVKATIFAERALSNTHDFANKLSNAVLATRMLDKGVSLKSTADWQGVLRTVRERGARSEKGVIRDVEAWKKEGGGMVGEPPKPGPEGVRTGAVEDLEKADNRRRTSTYISISDVGALPRSSQADALFKKLKTHDVPTMLENLKSGNIRRINQRTDGVDYYADAMDESFRKEFLSEPKNVQDLLVSAMKKSRQEHEDFTPEEIANYRTANPKAAVFAGVLADAELDPVGFFKVGTAVELTPKGARIPEHIHEGPLPGQEVDDFWHGERGAAGERPEPPKQGPPGVRTGAVADLEAERREKERRLPPHLERTEREPGADLTYQELPNKLTKARVEQRIAEQGIAATEAWYKAQDAEHPEAGAELTDAFRQLSDHYLTKLATADNPADIARLSAKAKELAQLEAPRSTGLGQAVQAYAMLDKYSGPEVLLEAQRLVEREGKELPPEVVKDIAETGQEFKKADEQLEEVRKELAKEEKGLGPGKGPGKGPGTGKRLEQLRDEQTKLIEKRQQAKIRQERTLAKLERPSTKLDYYLRFNNIVRGFMVSAIPTAVRNYETQGLRFGVERLTDLFAHGLRKAMGQDPHISSANIHRDMLRLFQSESRSKAVAIAGEYPKELRRLFATYGGGQVETAQAVRTFAGRVEKAFGSVETFVQHINWLNQLQEFHIRGAEFLSHMDMLVEREHGMSLEQFLRQRGADRISKEMIKDSVDHALEVTFADLPAADTRIGQHMNSLIKIGNLIPPTVSPIPFARWFYNSWKFNYQFSPLGLADLARTPRQLREARRALQRVELRPPARTEALAARRTVELEKARANVARLEESAKIGRYRTVAKAAIGTTFLLGAYAARSSPLAGEKWYEMYIPGTDTLIDTRPFAPFSTYLFIAEGARRMIHGERPYSKNEFFAGLGSSTSATGGMEVLYDKYRRGDFASLTRALQSAGSDLGTAILTPVRQIRDLIGEFDKSQSTTYDTATQPFAGPLKTSVPYGERLGTPLPKAYKPTSDEPIHGTHPATKFLGPRIITPKNFVEKEADRLRFDFNEVRPATGVPEIDQLEEKWMGEYVGKQATKLSNNPNYARQPDGAKAELYLKPLFTAGRTVARARLATEHPDLYMKLIERSKSARQRAMENDFGVKPLANPY